ncbi:MAG: multiheme c-type cytochrome [Bryobacteraceae bacterium]
MSQLDEDYYVEHGLSWYAAPKGFALTPGHRSEKGERYRTFDPGSAILRCFQCHSTGRLRLGPNFRIEPSEPGVHCESCHGPGADHAKAQKPIRNPGKTSAVEMNDLCGACHRKSAAAGENTDWTNPWNTRHQPLYLAQSACFLKSEGRLSCTSCHPAHAPMTQTASEYGQVCAGCHAKPAHASPIPAGSTCVGCHMPDAAPQPNLRFANHWIGVYEKGETLRPKARRP